MIFWIPAKSMILQQRSVTVQCSTMLPDMGGLINKTNLKSSSPVLNNQVSNRMECDTLW